MFPLYKCLSSSRNRQSFLLPWQLWPIESTLVDSVASTLVHSVHHHHHLRIKLIGVFVNFTYITFPKVYNQDLGLGCDYVCGFEWWLLGITLNFQKYTVWTFYIQVTCNNQDLGCDYSPTSFNLKLLLRVVGWGVELFFLSSQRVEYWYVRVHNLFSHILYLWQCINVPPFVNLKNKFHPHPTTLSSSFKLEDVGEYVCDFERWLGITPTNFIDPLQKPVLRWVKSYRPDP